jgi:hypothetical protein
MIIFRISSIQQPVRKRGPVGGLDALDKALET